MGYRELVTMKYAEWMKPTLELESVDSMAD